MNSVKKYVAEFIGTCVLVLLGCGTAMLVGCDAAAGGGYILTALAFGLVIVGMAYCVGNVSGCHINPAVSIAMLVSKKMTGKDFVGYVIAQCLGALVGAALLAAIFGLGGVTDSKAGHSSFGGLVIGLTLTLVHILGIGLTGTSVNPARSIGPAIVAAVSGNTAPIACVWVFIVAPLAGGALAAVVYNYLAGEK